MGKDIRKPLQVILVMTGSSDDQHQGRKGTQEAAVCQGCRRKPPEATAAPCLQVQRLGSAHCSLPLWSRPPSCTHSPWAHPSLLWRLGFQGRQGMAVSGRSPCLCLGTTQQSVMAQITPAAGKVQVLVASWTCPFGKHWGRISRRKLVTLKMYCVLLFLGYTTPNLAGGSSSFLHG